MANQAHPYFGNHPTGYEQFIKENPDDVEMQRLCFELFIKSEEGQKLYQMIQERFMLAALFTPEHPQAQTLSVYFDGFREAFRGLMNMAKIHKHRIENGKHT